MKNIFLVLLFCLPTVALYAGGFIIVMPDKHNNPNQHSTSNVNLFPLESRSTQVETKIHCRTATTTIKQVFYNNSNRQLEGYFLFPVPKDVVISKFSMDINGVKHQAELLDAQKAKKIYEEIVRRSKDPALLEYYGNGMFRVRIFPILPQKEQKIELTYTETLEKDNNTLAYTFPMNTKKHAAKAMNQVSFKIDITCQDKLKTIYCPTHTVEVIRKGANEATVGFEAEKVEQDRDFQLYIGLDNANLGLSVLNYKDQKDANGYFFMNLSPGFDAKQKVVSKDIVFVMDKSGSMAGEKLDQAKKALRFCIENLNEGDRFEIVPFSTEASALFGKVSPYNKENKAKAVAFIEDIDPIGGTNIGEALDLALAAQHEESKRPFLVVFMTDGKPTIGDTNEEELLKQVNTSNQNNVRIFTFGIGTNLNTHLLDKITAATKAYRTYVLPDEDIEVKVSDFYTKVSSPILTDIKVTFDKGVRVSEVYDKQIPDLFKGGSISLLGRYKGEGESKVTVSGLVNGEKRTFEYNINWKKQETKLDFIPSLWASRAVGYLLDQIRLQGENEELVKEVTRLAKKHGIITPYTSYLILEDEAITARQPNVRLENQVLRPRTLNAPTIAEDLEEEVAVFKKREKSGKKSVRASKESQALNRADNLGATKQGEERLDYLDQEGATRNLGDDIVNVQGRAIYQNNNEWVDANLSLIENQKLKTNRTFLPNFKKATASSFSNNLK
jgi:Ca-activated chloride channel family protein